MTGCCFIGLLIWVLVLLILFRLIGVLLLRISLGLFLLLFLVRLVYIWFSLLDFFGICGFKICSVVF